MSGETLVLDNLRKFIERVVPWPTDGQTAYVNLQWAEPNQYGTKSWAGRATTTPDEFVTQLRIYNRGDNKKDFYICMSLQAQCSEVISHAGKPYRSALRSAEEVVGLKSFFIDVDVKPGAYESRQEALDALKAFTAATNLPIPTAIVASGSGGFHAHWIVDRVLTRAEWQPLANALARAVNYHNFIADTQCTVDASRVLRIPDTANHKTVPPNPTSLMGLHSEDMSYDVFCAAMAPHINAAPIHAPVAVFELFTEPGPGAGDFNNVLGAGLDTTHDALEIELEDLASECPFIARTVTTGGAGNANPLWFITGTISTFLEKGREAFHRMSDKHLGYVVEKTDAEYDRLAGTREKRDLGWPKCATIASYGCKECATCPLFIQNKSPLNFARAKKAGSAKNGTVADTGDLPDRYVRSPEGIISLRVTDEATGAVSTAKLSDYPMTHGWLSTAPWTLNFVTVLSAEGRRSFEIPCEVITAKDTLAKYLGGAGLFCSESQTKIIKEFLLSWIQKLQKNKESVISSAPLGWSILNGNIEGFSYAGRMWMAGDDRPAASPSPALTQQYAPKGEIGPWNDLAKIVYEQDRPALNAILAVAFAAPLVHFTGFQGLIMNTYSSESGIGKTTAMKASQAVWGNPVTAMQGLNDTTNSIIGKMSKIKSLPVYWDEIKSETQIKAFCSNVFTITAGKEKSRMASDTSLREIGTWQTMLVSASNDSLVDGMAKEVGSTTAGLYRLFEFIVPPAATMTKDIGSVQRLTGKLDNNFGHAGLVYAKFLGQYHKRVEVEVAELIDALFVETAARQDERMWIATMAVTLKGAEYANELGLTVINVAGLKDFLFTVLGKMRAEITQSPSDLNNDLNVSSILAEFLKLHRMRGTLYTNIIWMRGRPPPGAVKVVKDASRLDQLQIQIGMEDKRMRISNKALVDFMMERGYSRATFVGRLESDFGGIPINAILGSGTDYSVPADRLFELDMNNPRLSKLIE
jgi:Domain of unknown function (DUF927)